MSRPSKLGPHILEAFKAILADDDNVLSGTDDDLFFALNDELPDKEQISYRSFQRYKHLALECGMQDEYVNIDDENDCDYFDPIYKQLYKLFRRALFRQKKILMKRMIEDDKHWRKWQWILERKFREWNLRWTSIEAERTHKQSEESEANLEPVFPDYEVVPVYIYPDGTMKDKNGATYTKIFKPFSGHDGYDKYDSGDEMVE